MNLIKDKESGNYIASFKAADGKTHTLSTKATSLKEAEKVVKDAKIQELEDAARTGRLTNAAISMIIAGRKVTMESALEEWIGWMTTLGRSKSMIYNGQLAIRSWLKSQNLESFSPAAIKEEHVARFINQPDGLAKMATRESYLSMIRSLMDFCLAKGWSLHQPARLVEVDMSLMSHRQKEKREGYYVTDDEVDKLMETAGRGSFWYAAVAIGRHTGLRIGDIATLEWGCISNPKYITVWTTKRDKRVNLPLENKTLRKAIGSIPFADVKDQFMFPEMREAATHATKRSIFSVQFSRLVEKAGITRPITFHDLRGTYITEALNNGRTLEHIAKEVGHSFPSTTLKYVRKEGLKK